MICSRREIYALADELATRKDLSASKGAIQRAVVGRAYYSAFHAAMEVAMHLKAASPAEPTGQHAKVRIALENAAGTLAATFRLKKLHEQRVEADYYLDVQMDPSSAIQALDTATRVIKGFEAVLAAPRGP